MGRNNKDGLNNKKQDNFNGSFDKAYYEKYKAKLGTHTHKGLIVAISAAVVLVAGGVTGGFFAYKALNTPHQETIDERVVVDPSVSKYAEVSNIEYAPNGDAVFIVALNPQSRARGCIRNVRVSIGKDNLTSSEFEFRGLNTYNAEDPVSPKQYRVTIYKETLTKHEGKITVIPDVDYVRYPVAFKVNGIWIDSTGGEHILKTEDFGDLLSTQNVAIDSCATMPDIDTKLNEITKTGTEGDNTYSCLGWRIEGSTSTDYFDFNTPVTEKNQGFTLVADIQPVKAYTVTFNYMDKATEAESTKDTVKVVYSNTILEEHVKPTKEGHTFSKWTYTNDQAQTIDFNFGEGGTHVYKDLTVYANWTINKYHITFDLNGATSPASIPDQYVEWNKTITKPTPNPEKTGYTFKYWMYHGEEWDFSKPVVEDMQLKAEWTPDIITVNFLDTDGSTPLAPQQKVNRMSTVYIPADPTKEGHTFTGWYDAKEGGNLYDFNAPVNPTGQTLDIFAHWNVNEYTISFDANGGDATPASYKANYGTTLTAPTDVIKKTGYKLVGWTFNDVLWKFGTDGDKVKGDMILKARWEDDPVTVTFLDATTETSIAEPQKVNKGSLLKTPTQPKKDGYTFTGWYTDKTAGKQWNFYSDIIPADYGSDTMPLYARFTQDEYTVKFDFNGGTGGSITRGPLHYGDVIKKPGEEGTDVLPTKTGYKLSGWTYNDVPWDFTNDKVKGNMTLKARWDDDIVTVKFFDEDGTTQKAATQRVRRFSTLTQPENPTKLGWTFDGWYDAASGGTKWNFMTDVNPVEEGTTTPKNEMNLYARFTEDSYTVTFDVNGGTGAVEPQTDIKYGGTVTKPTTDLPTKTGYTLAGWSYNDVPWDFANDKVKGNMTLKAIWAADEITVNFIDSTDETTILAKAQTVNRGSMLETPTSPTKENYTFAGWYTTAKVPEDPTEDHRWQFFTDKVDTQVPAGTHTYTLYARWTFNYQGVKFTESGDHYVASLDENATTVPSVIEIPAQYKGKPVTEIGYFGSETPTTPPAFTTLILPSTITEITEGAFQYCTSLSYVNLPTSPLFDTIPAGCFMGCTSLKSITIPTNIRTIGDGAFAYSGLSTITIPSSVRKIGAMAFGSITGFSTAYFESTAVWTTTPGGEEVILNQNDLENPTQAAYLLQVYKEAEWTWTKPINTFTIVSFGGKTELTKDGKDQITLSMSVEGSGKAKFCEVEDCITSDGIVVEAITRESTGEITGYALTTDTESEPETGSAYITIKELYTGISKTFYFTVVEPTP